MVDPVHCYGCGSANQSENWCVTPERQCGGYDFCVTYIWAGA